MQVPSLAWLQQRLHQLRGTTPAQDAAIESLEALLAMFRAQIDDIDDFPALTQLSRALVRTEAQQQAIAALKADPHCAALIAERYLPPYHDVNALLKCPQHSLGYAYAVWLKGNTELYADLYSDLAIDSETSYVEARLGQTHDLWHLITGFDTSVESEIGLQAFHLAQFPYPLAAMLIANALVDDTLMNPANLPRLLAAIESGWKLGKQAQPLFAQKWELLWDTPLAQLRQELNLTPPTALVKRHSPPPITAALRTRKATLLDIPFLAQIIYAAALPPQNHCFWDDILQGTGTNSLEFIAAMLRAEASNWGNVADFSILEEGGIPVAAAAGYTPNTEDYCPLRLSCLDKIAQDLGWSTEVAIEFGDRYEQFWGGDCRPIFLTPLAPWIIETVAVVPAARGRRLDKVIVAALIAEGRSQQHSHAGIMIINSNDAARHTYESIGFKPYQTYHADYFKDLFDLEFPGITKFGMCLN
jgi:ubiquinone biosynthesis protein Coq4/GNAT superfamily N-acetyltransferase